MSSEEMSSLDRVLCTLGHKEPDRVPFFLLATMHGARELGMTQSEYFSKGENVARGQLKMLEKYGHDCLCNIFYAPLEIEAWGGEVIFREDGPANSGRPFIKNHGDIESLEPPEVANSPELNEVFKATKLLFEAKGGKVPIIGVVMSPFSLPVMQMGFDHYLDLLCDEPELFWRLMKVNQEFCVEWANAQLEAGATAICYFDPMSSSTIIPRELYQETGFKLAKETIARIKGPTATHFASGRCLPIVDDVAQTGTAIIGTSILEDLGDLKKASKGRLTLLGNLNGITMRKWTPAQAEEEVKKAIARGGPGGGFILSDNHGEIPLQVPEETLMAVSRAARKWGRYPLDWIDGQ